MKGNPMDRFPTFPVQVCDCQHLSKIFAVYNQQNNNLAFDLAVYVVHCMASYFWQTLSYLYTIQAKLYHVCQVQSLSPSSFSTSRWVSGV